MLNIKGNMVGYLSFFSLSLFTFIIPIRILVEFSDSLAVAANANVATVMGSIQHPETERLQMKPVLNLAVKGK